MALRASLASRGSAQGPSPPRAAWRPCESAEPACTGSASQRPTAIDGCRATPWLAAAGCANARRPQCWRFAPPRYDQRFTDTPPSLVMELPHHASSMPPQDAAGAFALSVEVVDLARIKGQAGEAVRRGCRVGPVSLRSSSSRPTRPWLVVNPGGGHGCALGFRPQPSGANNFPCAVTAFGTFLAGQILCASWSSTAFRPQAVRPAHPPPDGSQQGRDGRDLG